MYDEGNYLGRVSFLKKIDDSLEDSSCSPAETSGMLGVTYVDMEDG